MDKEFLNQATWKRRRGPRDLDQETRTSKPEPGNLDQESWTKKPGPPNLDEEIRTRSPGKNPRWSSARETGAGFRCGHARSKLTLPSRTRTAPLLLGTRKPGPANPDQEPRICFPRSFISTLAVVIVNGVYTTHRRWIPHDECLRFTKPGKPNATWIWKPDSGGLLRE